MSQPAAESRVSFFRSAGIVSGAVLLSRITGVVREVVMARFFGAGQMYDAFLLGMRIPNLMRNLFAEGALSAAFVPIFSQYLTTKGKREAAHLSNLVATALILIVGAICAVGIVFSPQLVHLMAPGFERVPGKFELAVLLTRIMFPFLVLVSLAAQAMGLLNACDRYAVPALASVFFNVGSVLFGLGVGYTLGRRSGHGLIVSMAFGVVAGGVLQLAWQTPSLYRAGFAYRPRMDFSHPGLHQIFGLMIPAVVGNAALQINTIVNTNLASSLTDAAGHVINGPVSWLGYAFRFLQLPLGVFGVAVATAALPSLSRNVASGRMEEFRNTLEQSLGMILLLTIPSSVGLAVLGESMIGAIYQWGQFQSEDTRQTGLALAGYSVGLAGYAATKLLAPVFYALSDARTPMLVSIASILVNLGLAFGMVHWLGMGHAGLALSTSLVALFGTVLLYLALRRRIGIDTRRLMRSAARIVAASAVMGIVCWISSLTIHAWRAGKTAHLIDVAVSIPLGVWVFYLLAQWFGVPEAETLKSACYTALRRNDSRPFVSDPNPGN